MQAADGALRAHHIGHYTVQSGPCARHVYSSTALHHGGINAVRRIRTLQAAGIAQYDAIYGKESWLQSIAGSLYLRQVELSAVSCLQTLKGLTDDTAEDELNPPPLFVVSRMKQSLAAPRLQ